MKKITLITAVTIGLAGAASAGVILGDVLAIDFGATAATNTANYNTSGHTATSVADLVRLSDGASTGVSFTLAGTDQDNINYVPGNEGNTTDADIYFDGILANLNAGAGNGNGSSSITLTFTGLDDTLTYDLIGGSARADDQNAISRWLATWSADGQSATTDGFSTGGYVSLTGLSSTGGTLVITADGSDQYTPIAQLELTVIPEPATLGLVATFGGGIMFLRRRFKK